MQINLRGEKVKIYDVNDLPKIIKNNPKEMIKRIKGKETVRYKEDFMTFDIETYTVIPDSYIADKYNSADRPYAYMYLWGLCLNDDVIMGRTWEEFLYTLNYIRKEYKLEYNRKMVIYVHNLGYEFTFLYKMIDHWNLFCKDAGKPLKFETKGFEWRCSWMLSNMSLQKFCENSKLCKHPKMSGEDFNYYIKRTPETILSDEEYGYQYCDVKGLHECIEDRLLDDTLSTIPMTATGYVRRDLRKLVYMHDRNHRIKFQAERLNAAQYRLLHDIFRGGDTHASRFYSGCVVEDLASYDEKSAYIYVIMKDYVPVGPLIPYEIKNSDDFIALCRKYCVMFRLELFGVKLKKDICDPYIDVGHVIKQRNVRADNGRVLAAEYIMISITEIDFEIILNQYDREKFNITECYYAKRGHLPEGIRQGAMEYFKRKTKLDGIPEKYYEYMKSKNLLNAIFGMMVAALVHDEISIKGDKWKVDEALKKKDSYIQEQLDKYYGSWNSFLSYQHGVYITAHARRRLNLLRSVVKNDSVYWDTDCLKFFPKPEYLEFIDKYNAEVRRDGFFAEREDGKREYLGVFTKEDHIKKFRTWGAKKYAYILDNGFYTTVAGMNKELGRNRILELASKDMMENGHLERMIEKYGQINMDIYQEDLYDNALKIFKLGLNLDNVGRTTAFYHLVDTHSIVIDGVEIQTGSNVGIVNTTYTLGVTGEYFEQILEDNYNPSDDMYYEEVEEKYNGSKRIDRSRKTGGEGH